MKNQYGLFNKNLILVIDEFGSIYSVPYNKEDFYYWEVFARLNDKIIPNILDGYERTMEESSGLDLSLFIASRGYAVFWPYAIGDPSIMIITSPRIPTDSQADQIKNCFNFLDSDKVSFVTSEYETPSLISCVNIFDSVNLSIATKKVNDYFNITSKLNAYTDTFCVLSTLSVSFSK